MLQRELQKANNIRVIMRTFAQHSIWGLVNVDNTNEEIEQGLMSVSLERDPNLSVAGFHLN